MRHRGAATLLTMDSEWPVVDLKLDASDDSMIADVIWHLTALIEPEGPAGLPEALRGYALKDEQFVLLSHDPGHASADRSEYAARLRSIFSKIEDQLPPEAPEIRLGGPRRG